MANDFSQTYAPAIVGATVEVAGHLVGRSLVDGLRSLFSTGTHVHKGDHFMDQSRHLLQQHLELMEFEEQNVIRRDYESLGQVFI